MPLNKRPPVYFTANGELARYAKLSKADWADAYADLYMQVFGEAEARTEIARLSGDSAQ